LARTAASLGFLRSRWEPTSHVRAMPEADNTVDATITAEARTYLQRSIREPAWRAIYKHDQDYSIALVPSTFIGQGRR